MIDIEKVREDLELLFKGDSQYQAQHGVKVGLAVIIQGRRNNIEQALNELERLQKKEITIKQNVKKFLKLVSKPSWLLLCPESLDYDCLLKELKDWSDEK